jgi:tRNA threonylcarbamoyladenosine biosynthesis protein TsaE
MELTTHSPEQTQALAERFADQLKGNEVIALTGEMGAGKTQFVHGLARGLQVPDGSVASPTFVLIREYHGRLTVYHSDLFRLEGISETVNVGLEEFYDASGVTVIEWANKIPGILPDQFLEIRFEVIDAESRKLSLIPHGKKYEGLKWR